MQKKKNPNPHQISFPTLQRKAFVTYKREARTRRRDRDRERESTSHFQRLKNQKDVSGIWISHLGLPKTPKKKKKQSCTEHDSSKKLGYDDNNALGREAEKRKRKNHLRKGSMLMAQMRIRDKRPVDWIPQFFGSLHNPPPQTSGFVFLLLLGSFCEREVCAREFVFVGGMRRMRERGGAFSACVLCRCELLTC
jgi:hypothetical protein